MVLSESRRRNRKIEAALPLDVALGEGDLPVKASNTKGLNRENSNSPMPLGDYTPLRRGRARPEDFDRLLLFQRAFIHLVTFMHHREAYERLGGFDESLEVLEDWDLFFRYSQDYDFLHVKETTARFHVRDDQSNAITKLREEFVGLRRGRRLGGCFAELQRVRGKRRVRTLQPLHALVHSQDVQRSVDAA